MVSAGGHRNSYVFDSIWMHSEGRENPRSTASYIGIKVAIASMCFLRVLFGYGTGFLENRKKGHK